MKNELGNIVKEQRMYWGLSQTELSKKTGIDIKTISLIERGVRRKPIPETLKKLSEALDIYDIDLLELAGYTEEEKINYLKYIKGLKKFEFEYTIVYKGHGMVYAYDKEDAESYLQTAFEDITATFDSDIDAIDEKMKLDECKTYLNVGDSNER